MSPVNLIILDIVNETFVIHKFCTFSDGDEKSWSKLEFGFIEIFDTVE